VRNHKIKAKTSTKVRQKILIIGDSHVRGIAVQLSQEVKKCVMGNARQTTNNDKMHVHSTRVVSHTRASVCTEVNAR
jgi:hypothetical protein